MEIYATGEVLKQSSDSITDSDDNDIQFELNVNWTLRIEWLCARVRCLFQPHLDDVNKKRNGHAQTSTKINLTVDFVSFDTPPCLAVVEQRNSLDWPEEMRPIFKCTNYASRIEFPWKCLQLNERESMGNFNRIDWYWAVFYAGK